MTATNQAAAAPGSRIKLLGGGGAALVLLVFLATKVLGGGGGGDQVAALSRPSPGAVTITTTPATAAPAAAEGPAPVETFEVFTTKNPFMPLRTTVAATAASPTAAPAAAAAPLPTSSPVTATPAAAPAPAPATTAMPAAASAAQTTSTGGHATKPVRTTRVALLDVFAEGDRLVANVRVNDTVSKVAAGDKFGSNFKVVSLDPAERCGRFLFGDDQFRLCKGEEALK